MHAEGSLEIAAPNDATWDALTDPDVLVACVPGGSAVSIERSGPSTLTLRGRIGQGLLSLPAQGQVELSGLERPSGAEARLTAGLAGTSFEAAVALALTALQPDLTRVAWTADASVAGPLAGMAAPYLDRDGPGVIARTLDCVKCRLESEPGPQAS